MFCWFMDLRVVLFGHQLLFFRWFNLEKETKFSVWKRLLKNQLFDSHLYACVFWRKMSQLQTDMHTSACHIYDHWSMHVSICLLTRSLTYLTVPAAPHVQSPLTNATLHPLWFPLAHNWAKLCKLILEAVSVPKSIAVCRTYST